MKNLFAARTDTSHSRSSIPFFRKSGQGFFPHQSAEKDPPPFFTSSIQKKPQANVPAIQRVVELRPPGRGEASAFGRAQETHRQIECNIECTRIQVRG